MLGGEPPPFMDIYGGSFGGVCFGQGHGLGFLGFGKQHVVLSRGWPRAAGAAGFLLFGLTGPLVGMGVGVEQLVLVARVQPVHLGVPQGGTLQVGYRQWQA